VEEEVISWHTESSILRKPSIILRSLSSRDQRIAVDAVDEQLSYQPTLETRNRKLLRPNPLAPWELRIGRLRVYYEVGEEEDSLITVLAVWVEGS
jgi:mRNA-degrading endonuclease RelE of RelBE toxin-antitoxin system